MFLRLFSTVFKRPCDCEIFVREPTFEALDCSDHVTVRHGLLGPDRVPRVLHDDGGQDDTSGRRGADQVSSLLPTLGGGSFCVRMAFRVLDKKGLGFIQSSSFKHLMTNIGASYQHVIPSSPSVIFT